MKKLLLGLFTMVSFLTFAQETSQYSTDQVLFIIKVKDSTSKAPIQSKLDIQSENEGPNAFHGRGSTDATGSFQLQLVISENVRLKLEKEQYMPINELINFQKSGYSAGDTVIKEFYLNKIEVGKSVTLDNVQFESGKATLKSGSEDQIETLIMLMNANPKMVIEIAGHTDNTGGKGYSIKLSEDRVEEVKRIIVEKGIKKNRIKGVGYGGAKPVASNRDEAGRTKNRRVEFKILKID